MNARQGFLLIAVFSGFVATLFFYLALLILQIANADNACESYPQTIPGADFDDVRGMGFQNSFLNLGGKCTYYMKDGAVVHTREPGWWFSGTITGLAGIVSAFSVLVARRKGHPGVLFGFATLFAPPLGVALAIAGRGAGLLGDGRLVTCVL